MLLKKGSCSLFTNKDIITGEVVITLMIQHTQFNKLTIDRIKDVFRGQFVGKIEPFLKEWREWIEIGRVQNRSFYISLNSKFEMDGILLHDQKEESGVIFAQSSETAQNLIERARKNGDIKTLDGDSESCRWAL